jgi:hypothetical protein
MLAEIMMARCACRQFTQQGGLALIISVFFFVMGCVPEMDNRKTPVGTLFQDLVAVPLAITASDIQGGGHLAHTGYAVFLRFQPSKPLVPVLVKKGYKETTFQEVAFDFELDSCFRDRFSPAWSPASIKHPRVFLGHANNTWTTDGGDSFVIDEETGIVYFYGVGM